MEKIRYLICNPARTVFFRKSSGETLDMTLAERFRTKADAEYWMKTAFSAFLRKHLTEIVKVKITIEILEEQNDTEIARSSS